MLPLRSVGRCNFDKGRHNSNNYVDSKSTYNYNELLYYIMKSTVDKVNYLYIYIYIIILYICYIYIYMHAFLLNIFETITTFRLPISNCVIFSNTLCHLNYINKHNYATSDLSCCFSK